MKLGILCNKVTKVYPKVKTSSLVAPSVVLSSTNAIFEIATRLDLFPVHALEQVADVLRM